MKEDLYSKDSFFNFEALRMNESKFRIKTENEEFIIGKCIDAREQKFAVGLISEPGYGVKTAFDKYIKDHNTKYKYHLIKPLKGEKFRDRLIEIIQLEIPPGFVSFNSSKDTHLINSITYTFKNTPEKERLIIVYNIQNLTETGLASLGSLIKSTENICGVILSVDITTYNKINAMSARKTFLAKLLSDVKQWFTLSPPLPEELANLCIYRGILSRKIIDQILKKAQDFTALNTEIENIKTVLKAKGRL
jgi:hypothetical protein